MITLKKVEIEKYKSFLEKQTIEIENGVTRIVGKNESGKTALLEAIAKFNYFDENDETFQFNSINDYPRGYLKKYEQDFPNNDFEVIKCTFQISDELLDKIKSDIGDNVFEDNIIIISKTYNNTKKYSINANQNNFIKNFLSDFSIEKKDLDDLLNIDTIDDLRKKLKNQNMNSILEKLDEKYINQSHKNFNNKISGYIAKKYIDTNLPKFLYFDEYYLLPGTINLNKFENGSIDSEFTKEQNDITKALFELANIDINKIMNSDKYEDFISELEATSNSITDEFSQYWSTNKNLEINFTIQSKENQYNILNKLLQIRIKNKTHRVTLPLKNRSKGFIWFFSFLIWFSKVQETNNLIILLDEPGLNLHAEAQNDLLKYIDNKLAPNYQVIYTTHSPFMIDSEKLNEVRTVYDSNDDKKGSIISNAIEEKDQGTLFPLQAALGYNLAQNLYISEKNLLVEGVADLMYLTVMSEILKSLNREGLNDDITIVPVGGLDKVATFISLLRGNKLNIVCLLDTFIDQKGKARLNNLIQEKIISENQIIFFDKYIERLDFADIEDMFEIEEYLKLFNNEFKNEFKEIIPREINETKSMIPQINKILNIKRFNHYRPAKYLTSICDNKKDFSEKTLERFEKLFKDINKLL